MPEISSRRKSSLDLSIIVPLYIVFECATRVFVSDSASDRKDG